MSWINGYSITNGTYTGRSAPIGDLTQGVSGAVVNPITGGINFDRTRRSDSSPNDWRWPAAFGMVDTPLMSRMDESIGEGWQYSLLIAEIPVKNATGATYFKQTICFYIDFNVAEYTYPAGSERLYTINCGGKMTRREYPNQGTYYTETVICQGGATTQFDMVTGTGVVGWVKSRMMVGMSEFTYQSTGYFGYYVYCETGYTDAPINKSQLVGAAAPISVLETLFGSFEPVTTTDPNEEPNEPGNGESGEGGGGGEHDRHQDPVPYPDDPPISGASAGFITMYEMTEHNMQTFATELFDFDWWQAIKNFFADPMDFICGVMIVPFSPRTSGHACPVFHQPSPLPDIKMNHYWPVIVDQYQDIDCGSLTIPKYYNSCFDYNPYTSVRIYLPYIGYKDLDPDEVMGNTIQVKYKVDCMTGDCIAFIIRTAVSMPSMTPVSQCIAQFSGNCGVRVAFGRQSFDSAIQASVQLMAGIAGGMIRGAGGAVSAFMVGGAGGGASSESEALAQEQLARGAGGGMSMPNVEAMKSQVIKSGIMGANAGFMSVQKPFIIRSLPNQSRPNNYRELNGYPSNIAGPIGSGGFRGYMEIEKIELDGITAMEQEKAELMALLGGGVLYGNS